jgi:hypothetical protein
MALKTKGAEGFPSALSAFPALFQRFSSAFPAPRSPPFRRALLQPPPSPLLRRLVAAFFPFGLG